MDDTTAARRDPYDLECESAEDTMQTIVLGAAEQARTFTRERPASSTSSESIALLDERRSLTDLLMRFSGVTLICVSVAMMRWLVALADSGIPHDMNPGEFLLAAVGFVTGSLGTALFVHGLSWLDEVEGTSLWHQRYSPTSTPC